MIIDMITIHYHGGDAMEDAERASRENYDAGVR